MLKRRMIYLAIVVFIAFINLLYIDYEPFLLLVVALLFPIVLFAVNLIAFRYIGIVMSMDKKVVEVEKDSDFIINVINSFIVPVTEASVEFKAECTNTKEKTGNQIKVSLGAGSGVQIKAILNMKHCGYVKIGIDNMMVYDCLKLFRVKKTYTDYLELWVFPKLFLPDEKSIFAGDGRKFLDDSAHYGRIVGSDRQEVKEIREYREGDSLNSIHWKLSSRNETMMVKEYEDPVREKRIVLVELFGEAPYFGLNRIYEMSYAIGRFFVSKNIDFQYAFYDSEREKMDYLEVSDEETLKESMKNILSAKVYSREMYAAKIFNRNHPVIESKVYYIVPEQSANEHSFVNLPVGNESIQNLVNRFYDLEEA